MSYTVAHSWAAFGNTDDRHMAWLGCSLDLASHGTADDEDDEDDEDEDEDEDDHQDDNDDDDD